MTKRSCSHCHTLNIVVPGRDTVCFNCGHRADVERVACDCHQCRPMPLPQRPGDGGATPAESGALLRLAGVLDVQTRDRLAALEARVAALEGLVEAVDPRCENRTGSLEGRVAALEVAASGAAHLPEECRARACSYYQHYLAQGPAELTHEGYHAAEKRCEAAQDACTRWYDAHPGKGDNPTLNRLAETWEKRVRA